MIKYIFLLIVSATLNAEPISEIGKVQEKNGKHYFVVKKEDKNILYLLPDSPKKLFVKCNGGDESVLKEHEGTTLPRWRLKGELTKAADGKSIITKVSIMKPQGPGYLRVEELTTEGVLEIKKGSNGTLSFNIICKDKTIYFLPAKKFKPLPGGFSAEKAADLNGKKVKMKAKVQVRQQSPHRVATLVEFRPVK